MSMDQAGTDVDVAIIGGGAAGCLLAIALGEAGVSVALLERSERLPFNGGEFLKPPGLAALRRHGLDVPISRAGRSRRCIRYFHDGDELFTYDYAEHTQIGHYVIVPYAAIISTMAERLEELDTVAIRTGVGSATSVWDGDRIDHVALERGGSVRARVVVGADGARSLMRAAIGAPEQPQPYDQHVYMASFPLVESVAALNRIYLSSKRWIAYLYPIGPRFRLAMSAPAEAASELFSGGVEDFVDHLRAFVSQSDDALAAIDSLDGFVRLPISNLHTSRYSRGNAVLLGDAAHHGHPVTGLGMNQALGDAVALADALLAWAAGELSLGEALTRYQDERWPSNERTYRYGYELLRRYEDRQYYLDHFDHALHAGATNN